MLAIHITDQHPNSLPGGFPPPGAPDTQPDDCADNYGSTDLHGRTADATSGEAHHIIIHKHVQRPNDVSKSTPISCIRTQYRPSVYEEGGRRGGGGLRAHAYSNARSMVPMGLHYHSYGIAVRHYMLQNTLPLHGMLQKNMSILFFSTENKP